MLRLGIGLLVLFGCGAGVLRAEENTSWDRQDDERPSAWADRLLEQADFGGDHAKRTPIYAAAGREGSQVAVKLLLEMMKREPKEAGRDEIAKHVALIGGRKTAHLVKALARTRDQHWPDAARIVFAALKRPDREEPEEPWLGVVDQLLKAADEEHQRKLLWTLDMLGVSGTAAVGRAIQHGRPDVALMAILYLEKRKDDWRAAAALADNVPIRPKVSRFDMRGRDASDDDVREGMNWYRRLEALGKIGTPAIPYLLALIKRKSKGELQNYARLAIRKAAGGPRVGYKKGETPYKTWKRWWTKQKAIHVQLEQLKANREY